MDKVITIQEAREQIDKVKRSFLVQGWTGTQLAALMSLIPVIPRPHENIPGCLGGYTTGHLIFFTRQWFEFDLNEQRGVLLHEVIHCQYQHVARGQLGHKIPIIWQYAADAIANYLVDKFNEEAKTMPENRNPKEDFFVLPQKDKVVNYKKIIKPKDLRDKPIQQWTCEDIYFYIRDGKSLLDVEEIMQQEYLYNDLTTLEGNGLGTTLEGNGLGTTLTEEEYDALPEDTKAAMNLPIESMTELWNERIKRIERKCGSQKGKILGKLEAESCVSEVPWNKVLRSLIKAPFYNETKPDYLKCSRRFRSTNKGRRYKIFEPARKPSNRIKELVIGVDTSGSMCFPDTMSQVFAEVSEIQQQTKCTVYLLQGDTEVQSETKYPYDRAKTLFDKYKNGGIEIKGFGGTSFNGIIRRMEQINARYNIFITDLEVDSFPTPCFIGGKLLWLGIGAYTKEVPYGRVLHVKGKF